MIIPAYLKLLVTFECLFLKAIFTGLLTATPVLRPPLRRASIVVLIRQELPDPVLIGRVKAVISPIDAEPRLKPRVLSLCIERAMILRVWQRCIAGAPSISIVNAWADKRRLRNRLHINALPGEPCILLVSRLCLERVHLPTVLRACALELTEV